MNRPIGSITEDEQWVELTIYRGTDTEQLNTISWWTTDIREARMYALNCGPSSFILERTIRLPLNEGYVCNPHAYLLGGKASRHSVRNLDLKDYLWGLDIDRPMKATELEHFYMSIHKEVLELISHPVAVHMLDVFVV